MAKGKGSGTGDVQPIIIIKKVKKVAGGHHGGAWKVAYADFVTAMMAFFLLLWLLNVTTEEQKNAISNFFDPTHPIVSESMSGAGGVMGGTAMSTEGAQVSTIQEMSLTKNSASTTQQRGSQVLKDAATGKLEEELRRRETERLEKAKKELEDAVANNAELAELKKHMLVDVTPEGLRIQIVDQEGDPMFASGSAQMFDKTRKLVTMASNVIKTMPNKVSVRGHTDATPYKAGATYTNWELSADRANSTRRVLAETGVPESRLSNVMGKADTEHLIDDKPADPRNRRITIIMEREDLGALVNREGAAAAREIGAPEAVDAVRQMLKKAAEEPYKRTQGNVYFP